MKQSFKDAFVWSRDLLSDHFKSWDQSRLESEAQQLVLAAYRLSTGHLLSRMDLFTRFQDAYPQEAFESLKKMSQERASGKLLQHVTGFQFFLNHLYEVNSHVLIPRPETEVLVSTALSILREKSPMLGLEVGLGSGAISIEMLSALPQLRMLGSEVSEEARKVASRNTNQILTSPERLKILDVENSLEVLSPFFKELQNHRADFLISNPPYLASESEVDLDVLQYEPHLALFAPKEDPNFFYRVLAQEAAKVIRQDGYLFAELPHERANEIYNLFIQAGLWKCKIVLDLTQRERVLVAQLVKGESRG